MISNQTPSQHDALKYLNPFANLAKEELDFKPDRTLQPIWNFEVFFLITFLLLVLFTDLFATEGVLAVWLRSQLLVVALGLQSSGNTGMHHRSWLHFQFKNRFSLFVAILLLLLLLWF